MSMAVREVSQTRGASRPHSSQRARRWLQWTRFIRQAMVLMAGAFEDKMRLRIRRGDSTGSQSTIGWLPGLSTNVYYAVSRCLQKTPKTQNKVRNVGTFAGSHDSTLIVPRMRVIAN